MIFLEKGSLNKSWSYRLFSLTGFNSNSLTSIPVILIWESYPILPPILSLSRLSFLCYSSRTHACNIPQMLSKTTQNTKRLLQSLRNLVCYSDWTRSPFTSWWNASFWLNPVVYVKKNFWVCQCLLGKRYQSFNLQPRGERSRVGLHKVFNKLAI